MPQKLFSTGAVRPESEYSSHDWYFDQGRRQDESLFCFRVAILLRAGTSAQPSTSTDSHVLFLQRLVTSAIERTHHAVRYDPAYVRIPYPGGDVPADTGVCTDEIIRAYRAVGVDLQKEVHEDMQDNFSAYPHKWRWNLGRPDTNIDHRRVPNLMVFFARKGDDASHHRIAETTTNPATLSPTIWAAAFLILGSSSIAKAEAEPS